MRSASAACVSWSRFAARRDVALDIDAQRRPDRAGAREPVDDARAALEHHPDPLMVGFRTVDRIVIGEVVGRLDLVARRTSCPAGSPSLRADASISPLRRLEVDLVVVVPGVVVAPVSAPVLAHEVGDRDAALGEDVEPEAAPPRRRPSRGCGSSRCRSSPRRRASPGPRRAGCRRTSSPSASRNARMPSLAATRSAAALVGIERATPARPLA